MGCRRRDGGHAKHSGTGAHKCQESTQGTGKAKKIMQATCSSPVHLLHGVCGNGVDKEVVFEAKVVKILFFHFQ